MPRRHNFFADVCLTGIHSQRGCGLDLYRFLMRAMKPFDRVILLGLIPVTALVTASAIYIEIVRPRGPFPEGDETLSYEALNYVAAEFFQFVFAVFLIVIGVPAFEGIRESRGTVSTRALSVTLLALYLATFACFVLLAAGPQWSALTMIGLLIIGLSWIAVGFSQGVKWRGLARNVEHHWMSRSAASDGA